MSQKKTKIGTIITQNIPQISNQLPSMGFDFLFIDLEHGNVTDTTITSIIQAKQKDCKILIRISEIKEASIKQALDLGCDGIIAPRVESLNEIKTLVDFSYYSPVGKRSVGFCLANKYGHNFNEYTNNFSPILLPQVESIKGLEIAKEIVGYDKISGIFMGPYDLSMSMGIPGEFESEEFIKAYESVRNICTENNKLFCTYASDNKKIEEEISKGTDMIAVGVDTNLIMNMYSELIQAFK